MGVVLEHSVPKVSVIGMKPFDIERLHPVIRLYEGCGNMLGIVPLTFAGYPEDQSWEQDTHLRRFLALWGKKIKSDSIMVLSGNPHDPSQEYDFFMDVFEPYGTDNTGSGLAGGVSTMCGNGIRAVAAYTRTFKPDTDTARIMTRSGLRIVTIDKVRNLYSVDMGEFASSDRDLAGYINGDLVKPNSDGEFIHSAIPAGIFHKLQEHTSARTWDMGLTGDRKGNKIDGEPHIVIVVPNEQVDSIEALRALAVETGPIVTKDQDHFPLEINVNFISIRSNDGKKVTVWNCTHERNLGIDADHSVTAACGTGSTVVGAVLFKKGLAKPDQYVEVKNTGGDLEISLQPKTGYLILTGPAQEVPLDSY